MGSPWEVNGCRVTNTVEQGPPSDVHGHRITNIIDQCPHWEVYSRPVDKEIPRVLWKMEVHYRVYNSSLLVPVLTHASPVHSVSRSFFSKWFTRGVEHPVVMNDYTDKQTDKLFLYKQLIYFTILMLVPWWWLFKKPKHVARFGQLRAIVWNTTVNNRPSVCSSVWYSIILCLRLFLVSDLPPSDFATKILCAMHDFGFPCVVLSCVELSYGAQWGCGTWYPIVGSDHVVRNKV